MEWVVRILAGFVSLALLAGIVVWVWRASIVSARRVWLAVFTIVVGGGITMMDAHAFVAKWAFKGDSPRDGLVAMMDGTAYRPFVYRRLVPGIVRAGTTLVLERAPGAADRLVADSPLKRYRLTWIDDQDWSPRKAVAFHLAYLVVWLALFGTLLAGAALIVVVRKRSAFEAILTSSLAMCLVPLMFVGGGYMYDAPELFLWTSLLAIAIAGPLLLTVPVFVLMLFNKESALLTVPAMLALFHARVGPKRALVWAGSLGVIGLGWDLFLRRHFAGLPGGSTEWWLPMNLEFWANPKSYALFGQLYSPGLVSPRGANVLLLLLFLLPVRFGWSVVRRELRWAIVLTALVLAPFFLAFCYRDEVRNLSLLFPLLYVLGVEGVHALFKAEGPSAPTARPSNSPST